MINKVYKILILSTVIFCGIFYCGMTPVFAQANLTVDFERTPLFKEANFLPGEGVARWIKVTNNSGDNKKIIIETINENNPSNFASQFNINIKKGAEVLYNNTLANFFNHGETYLSDLVSGATAQYDLTITFKSETNNDFQGKSLGFDILIGFQGGESVSGNESGGAPSGLTITNETNIFQTDTSVIIEWDTSYPSSSQVIYGKGDEAHVLNLSDNAGVPPKYGYAHTTAETDISPKVTHHLVVITGLTPSTTYYYRAISHASLAVSREHVFTTLALSEESEILNEGNRLAINQNDGGAGITSSGGGGSLGGDQQNIEEIINIIEPVLPEENEEPTVINPVNNENDILSIIIKIAAFFGTLTSSIIKELSRLISSFFLTSS